MGKITSMARSLPRPLRAFLKRHMFWRGFDRLHKHNKLHRLTKLNEEESENFLVWAVSAAILVLLVKLVAPSVIPYGFFEFWNTRGTVKEWLWSAHFVFAWGFGITIISSIFTRNSQKENDNAEAGYVGGIITSILAGVLEEISFRWLIFLSAIATTKFFNWLLFGFAGWGFLKWLHLTIFGPLANFFTMGFLENQLINPEMWAVGAAMLYANGLFRDGHKYQGLFGLINSWFGGMFFFWMMYTYGLPAAILVHFLYDFGIYTIRYIDCVMERASA